MSDQIRPITTRYDELPLSDRARKAIAAARSARFEFGESGPA